MIEMIKRHHRINGFWFSIAEFVLIALVVGPFAVYYLIDQRTMMAFITSGITANCLLMVVIGIQMLRYRTDPGNLGATIWNKQARPRLLRENSHMLRDNTILSLALLTPFFVLAMVLYELAASSSSAAHDSGASR